MKLARMVERSVFKEFGFVCGACERRQRRLQWDYDPAPTCCDAPMHVDATRFGEAAAVLGDEIDIVIKHGPVNPDGSPRRYRSRAELRAEEIRTGWTKMGETPNTHPRMWGR